MRIYQVVICALLGLAFCSTILAQKSSLMLSGGLTQSVSPIYTMIENSQVLNAHPIYKLSFTAGYNHPVKDIFYIRNRVSFKTIGGNSLNKHAGESSYFIHSVSLHYLSLSILPFVELKLQQFSFAFAIGGTAGVLINDQVANFQILNNELTFLESEEAGIKKWDYGLNGTVEIRRMIANGFHLAITLERYIGLQNVNNSISEDKIFLTNNSMQIGLEIPLGK